MHQALTSFELTTLTSHCQPGASLRKAAVTGISRLAIARTRSEEAAGGRELIATAELMPGDRVNLNQHGASTDAVAKGFIHFDLTAEAENPPSMRVVAFGESDAVQIVRFGEQTFSFSPGILARLTRHSAITTWGVLIFSLLGMMAVYKGGSELGEGSLRESRTKLRSKWRALRGGGV